jgi:hypothetical protein
MHAVETDCVKNHLHLLALQKAVLLSLNAQRELADVVAIDSQLPSGCYKRLGPLSMSQRPNTENTFRRSVSSSPPFERIRTGSGIGTPQLGFASYLPNRRIPARAAQFQR